MIIQLYGCVCVVSLLLTIVFLFACPCMACRCVTFWVSQGCYFFRCLNQDRETVPVEDTLSTSEPRPDLTWPGVT